MIMLPLTLGVTVVARLVASMSCQVVPLLAWSRYCCRLTAVRMPALLTGISWAVIAGGENLTLSGHGPAPATMTSPLVPVFLLAFHCSLRWYVVPAVMENAVCTNAALGEKVPAKPPLSFQATMCPGN